ncbi:bifunctional acetate--CoA ligase family protein/GNAT family N-acetyltransferase [cf. Phormidesmis sp. LEGE 11477]|uniref:bifunctional acetate--CoA ligase family protein/GNAT family N-acetyltransferase n=1 Tax=cf. Phormidesmis sp. LEGE 11477 TaxID=1828680 RepID=UPI001D1465BA|nr:bifunctional acetate--CoA ligase family protein/GNAT family N-acetyltransferase [cf. Phormidesmis sp. LEGE 11477]
MPLRSDPAHDVLRTRRQPLDVFFNPQAIALIGATDKPTSVGRRLLWNLIRNPFGGTVYPVNPKRSSVLGIKAYAHLLDIPESVDLAVIAIPAPAVPGAIRDCVAAGVKGAIVISSGFREVGAAGIALEQEISDLLRESGLRLIGPNCLGVMNPHTGFNGTFASAIARPGNVGFISQSGALCTSILDWSFRENVGFSAFVSVGSMLDVGWGDLINYLGDDPKTASIVIYMESIGNARAFLSAAREVAFTKPIIVIKAGRTQAAAAAAASHTGALTGSDEVLDAAFRRCGVLRVDTIDDLFNLSEILAKQPRPKGNRLTIVTNAGGPGVLATDSLIRNGGELAVLSPQTKAALDACLPAQWSHHNPIDILGDATPERYQQALEVVAKDPNSDGLLVVLTPQAMTDPQRTAEKIQSLRPADGGPMLATWMGQETVQPGEDLLNEAGIFTLAYPDTAARVFTQMWRYYRNLRSLYETPAFAEEIAQIDVAKTLIERVRADGRTLMTELESQMVLSAYGIPTVVSQTAVTADAAVECAQTIGYPVVVKLWSQTITHKTDVGGVYLNLTNDQAVYSAFEAIQQAVASITTERGAFLGVTVQPMVPTDGYELILGSSVDPQFGPVLLFGLGGELVEVFQDRALGLPPLNTTLARRMMEQTKIYKALKGVRGRSAVDLKRLEQLLVRFSRLVIEQPWIKEIDINPLRVTPAKGTNNRHCAIALDARIILHPADTPPEDLPKPAIRPYPHQYEAQWTLKTGESVLIRPIEPEDEPLIVTFHQTLSDESVYMRYAHMFKLSGRTAHERLTRICFIDYDHEIALVVEANAGDERAILGVGRLSQFPGTRTVELSMLVSDRHQHQGIGSQLMKMLITVAKQERIDQIVAEILPENIQMQQLCRRHGFAIARRQLGRYGHSDPRSALTIRPLNRLYKLANLAASAFKTTSSLSVNRILILENASYALFQLDFRTAPPNRIEPIDRSAWGQFSFGCHSPRKWRELLPLCQRRYCCRAVAV